MKMPWTTGRAPAPVTVASDAHYQARGIDFGQLRRRGRGLTGMPQYAVSKLCNVLFSQELARRIEPLVDRIVEVPVTAGILRKLLMAGAVGLLGLVVPPGMAVHGRLGRLFTLDPDPGGLYGGSDRHDQRHHRQDTSV